MSTKRSIAKAAMVIMLATLFGRFAGFIRETFIAAKFGASMETDAFLVAYTLPNILGITITGAFNAAFIPVFTQNLLGENRDKAWRLASSMLNIVFIAFAIISVVGIIFAPTVVKLMAPGFTGQTAELTTQLMRIMFPSLIFLALVGLTSGMLNALNHFLMPSLGPLVSSVAIIGSLFILVPSMGVYGLAVGTLVGFTGQFLVTMPELFKRKFRYSFNLDYRDPDIRRIGELIIPVLIGVGIGQINIIIDRILASGLNEGSISALNYAYRIMQLPLGLFVAAIAVPIFPALSEFAARQEMDKLKNALVKGMNVFALIMIPASVGLMVLATPIVRLLFQRGAFNPEDTTATAIALIFYSIGLVGYAVRDIMTRVFYAVEDTMSPVVIGGIGVAIHIILNIILVRFMAHAGLALATSIITFLNMLLLAYWLRRKIGSFFPVEAWLTWVKVCIASGVMAVSVWLVSAQLEPVALAWGTKGTALQVGSAIGTGALVYLGLILIFKVPEVNIIINLLREKLNSRKLAAN